MASVSKAEADRLVADIFDKLDDKPDDTLDDKSDDKPVAVGPLTEVVTDGQRHLTAAETRALMAELFDDVR